MMLGQGDALLYYHLQERGEVGTVLDGNLRLHPLPNATSAGKEGLNTGLTTSVPGQ